MSGSMLSITLAQAQEVLAGLVERVTFHSEESDFCVLRVKVRGRRDLITVVGHATAIAAGEWVNAVRLLIAVTCRIKFMKSILAKHYNH